jgi:carbon monoxide dehydrogenase subunit G
VLLEVSRSAEVAASPAATWTFIRDVPRLTGCLPNVSDLSALEADRRYSAIVSDKLGPFRLTVPVQIELRTVEEPRRIVAGLTGADSRGQARVRGDLEAVIEPVETGVRLTLGMKLEILGKLAALGAVPMRRRADDLFADFVRRVDAELTAGGGAHSGGST